MGKIPIVKKNFHGLIFQVYDNNSIPGANIWSDKFHRRQAGGHRIASFLRNHDWDIEVIDFAAKFTLEELKQLTKTRISKTTRFISFGCIFGSWPENIAQFADWFKKSYPQIAITYGGTSWPFVNSKAIDYYITGYGEQAMLKLLQYIVGNSARSSVPFDFRFADRKVISANQSCPSFPLNILSIDYQDRDFLLPDEWLHTELSRGCIFKCKFCNYPVLNVKGDYTQDQHDFYRNMQSNYDKFGIKNYYVVDETFNDSSEKIKKFADAVQKLNFVPFYSGFIRADLLVSRPQDREELLRMNFLGHHYGIESLNHSSAKSIGKAMPPEKLSSGLLEVKNYFLSNKRKIYRGTMSFIAGLPYETISTMLDTVDWLNTNWKDQSAIWFALSLPDSKQTKHGWTDSISDLALEFEKYGYVVDPTVPTDSLNGELAWKNPNLDYTKCKKFVEKIIPQKCQTIVNRVTSLTLDELTYPGCEIDQGLGQEYTRQHFEKSLSYRNKIVDQYKSKKLNF